MRMLCSEARVDLARVRTGHLSDREFRELAEAAGRLSYAPIYVDDTPAVSVLELRAKARRLHRDPAAEAQADRRRLPPADAQQRGQGQPRAGDLRDLAVAEGAGQGAARAGHRALAAQPPGREPRPRQAAAGRPARVGRHRAGRRRDHVHLPRGGLRRGHRQAGRGRDHRREAAQRPDRQCRAHVPARVHAVREPRGAARRRAEPSASGRRSLLRRPSRRARTSRTRAATSAARTSAPIIATASAPAASHGGRRVSAVMPPMATSGSGEAARTAREEREPARRQGACLGAGGEDRPHAEVVGAVGRAARACVDVVGRDADDRAGAEDGARRRDREVVLPEVDAVGVRGAGHVGPVVHDEQRARPARDARRTARAAVEQLTRRRRSSGGAGAGGRRRRAAPRPGPPDRGRCRADRRWRRAAAGRSRVTRRRRRTTRRIGMPSSVIFFRSVLRLMPEHVGGLHLVAAGALEHELDERALDGADQRVVEVLRRPAPGVEQLAASAGARRPRAAAPRSACARAWPASTKSSGDQRAAAGQDGGAQQGILELAHVARPAGARMSMSRTSSVTPTMVVPRSRFTLSTKNSISSGMSARRSRSGGTRDADDVQPEEEVLAEAARPAPRPPGPGWWPRRCGRRPGWARGRRRA